MTFIYCSEGLWMCYSGRHLVEARGLARMEKEPCADCIREKGESEGPVSCCEPCPVRTGERLYCSGKCASDSRDLTNLTERAKGAEGTCARCGAWINDPFARAEMEG